MIGRSIYIIGLLVCSISCNNDLANDCLQSEGDIIEKIFEVESFSKIRIEGEVSLIIKQGATQEVAVETGENLFSDITVTVEDETLIIRDANYCNFFRDYGITNVTVTAPNVTRIRNSSSYDVRSEGVLQFPELTLVSNTSGGVEQVRKGGDFYVTVDCDRLIATANGQSIFYISGHANSARISFTDENPRFEGENLSVDELEILQVSANDMIVNPQQRIFGIIRGTGDVISVNRPPVNEMQVFYTGQLIFQD